MAGSRSKGKLPLPIDPVPMLVSSSNAAIAFFAKRDLLAKNVGDVAELWDLPEARRIVRRQSSEGSWRYPGGGNAQRSAEDYDQLETFRQLAILVEKFGATTEHPAVERAGEFLLSFQTDEGDLRGIYGNQYATTYVGAITEILIKAGFGDDRRIAKVLRWLLATRQDDGGWAIPLRTVGVPFAEFVDTERHPDAIPADKTKPSSHLVTGMALRAFAASAGRGAPADVGRARALLVSRLFKRDCYGDRAGADYWMRVSFPFWFTDIVSALDTLSRLGWRGDDPPIESALERVAKAQRTDGTFAFKLLRDKDPDLPLWICLAVCRSLERWRAASHGGSA